VGIPALRGPPLPLPGFVVRRPNAGDIMGFLDRFFRKQASADRWKLAKAVDNGKPLIFRIRETTPECARKEGFPLLLAVCWKYKSPNDEGMPSKADSDRMGELEDLLMPALEGKQKAFLTVVVTGNGVREWQWYATDKDAAMKLVNKALGDKDPFPVEFVFQEDPEWEAYSRFLGD
jgi:hypothetical protein